MPNKKPKKPPAPKKGKDETNSTATMFLLPQSVVPGSPSSLPQGLMQQHHTTNISGATVAATKVLQQQQHPVLPPGMQRSILPFTTAPSTTGLAPTTMTFSPSPLRQSGPVNSPGGLPLPQRLTAYGTMGQQHPNLQSLLATGNAIVASGAPPAAATVTNGYHHTGGVGTTSNNSVVQSNNISLVGQATTPKLC